MTKGKLTAMDWLVAAVLIGLCVVIWNGGRL